jgi:hypothetical protein
VHVKTEFSNEFMNLYHDAAAEDCGRFLGTGSTKKRPSSGASRVRVVGALLRRNGCQEASRRTKKLQSVFASSLALWRRSCW